MKIIHLKTLFLSMVLAFSATSNAGGDHGMHEHMNHSPAKTSLELTVYKSATCGCCKKWVDHLQQQGFKVETLNSNDLPAIKDKFSIGKQYRSCHTAVSPDNYVFEGHIPAKVIARFLKEKPKGALGLAVPAMPVGSPGMEVKNKFLPYLVLLLKQDGSTSEYTKINRQYSQY